MAVLGFLWVREGKADTISQGEPVSSGYCGVLRCEFDAIIFSNGGNSIGLFTLSEKVIAQLMSFLSLITLDLLTFFPAQFYGFFLFQLSFLILDLKGFRVNHSLPPVG